MTSVPRERAALVGLFNDSPRHFDPEHALDELAGLADAAGADAVLRVQQERARPDPATFLGKGKVAMLAAAASEARVDTVIFDNELSPAQLRNLEGALDRKVVDRTQLILDIFARRARTREGKLQVELAQLKYLMPRLVGSSDALSRQGGGIGTLGPGETKLETDRRRIRHRISILSKEIDTVRRRRSQLRERRHKSAVPTVALVGYTNAGKTTLFNSLTGGDAVASNALFVTLDPLVRRVKLPDRRELLVSDTVGFIDRLPHSLVAAFRATLEEVCATRVPSVEVFNKCDQLGDGERARLAALYPGALCVSALTGEGRDETIAAMETRLALDTVTVTFEFDPQDERDREQISQLYRFGRILRHVASDTAITVEAELPKRLLERFRREATPVTP